MSKFWRAYALGMVLGSVGGIAVARIVEPDMTNLRLLLTYWPLLLSFVAGAAFLWATERSGEL